MSACTSQNGDEQLCLWNKGATELDCCKHATSGTTDRQEVDVHIQFVCE